MILYFKWLVIQGLSLCCVFLVFFGIDFEAALSIAEVNFCAAVSMSSLSIESQSVSIKSCVSLSASSLL